VVPPATPSDELAGRARRRPGGGQAPVRRSPAVPSSLRSWQERCVLPDPRSRPGPRAVDRAP
jgi:hypothetical protein